MAWYHQDILVSEPEGLIYHLQNPVEYYSLEMCMFLLFMEMVKIAG